MSTKTMPDNASTFDTSWLVITEELAYDSAWSPAEADETPRQHCLRLLKELVAEVGANYVYDSQTGCRYFSYVEPGSTQVVDPDLRHNREDAKSMTGQFVPSCIVGHLLPHVTSVDPVQLWVEGENETGVGEIVHHFPKEWTKDQGLMDCLTGLQMRQDEGIPWGIAVKLFEWELLLTAPDGAHDRTSRNERFFLVPEDLPYSSEMARYV